MNPDLDLVSLRSVFRASNRAHVPSFLAEGGAERLFDHLEGAVPWSFFLFSQKHLWEVTPESRRDYSEEKVDGLYELAYSAVQDGYAFLYEINQLTLEDPAGTPRRARRPAMVEEFEVFLSSEPFLDFVRDVTGERDVVRAEANATCFRSGQFLAAHDDSATSSRRVAFVMNLAKSWRPEWGGLLEFISDTGHIEEGFVPYFNSLNLFRVPQPHTVSCVAPFASSPRYAISGWLHSR